MGDTLLFSQLISLKKNTQVVLKGKDLYALSRLMGIHSSSLNRKLLKLETNPFFTIIKREGGFVVHRSNKDVSYKGVKLDLDSLSSFHLSNCELVLFSALLYFHLKQKDIPPRCKLAAMTGFSMRQIAYSLKSLKSKKLLIESNQTESYVRNTQEEGRVEDTRIRKVHIVNPTHQDILESCKIAPLKDINKNPVNTNGFNQSDLKGIIDYFSHTFKQSPVAISRLSKILARESITDINDLKKAIDQVKATPFLQKAAQFGWQEAVIECYQQQKARIWERSQHLTKYCQKKLGLNWIIKNIKKILSGYYDQKTLSNKAQKAWIVRDKPKGERVLQRNKLHDLNQQKIKEGQLRQAIRMNTSYSKEEKGARLHLMEKLGQSIYQAWIDKSQVIFENGTLLLKGSNRFIQDRLDLLLLKVVCDG